MKLVFSVRERRGNAMVTTEIGSGPTLPSVFCRRRHAGGATRRYILALAVLVLMVAAPGHARAGGPERQLTWGVHISLAPTW
ncbi:MAG: hypothetical protein KGM92_04785, partial [Acidobacteriota bacterium]|nr:hypothetical protein [Acidobacteriota bacterium]